jgi:LacI family transcriptional regulator
VKKFNKKVTIVDIAKKLGVSNAMVSMVLSGNGPKHRISKEAIKNVLETAKEMGYNPNLLARALRTGKTGVIGLIVADISNPFFAMIARLLENEAYKYQYDVMFASSDEVLEKFKKLGDTLLTRQVDGLIITPVIGAQDIIEEWQAKGVPIVSIDRYLTSLSIPYAVTDNYNASIEIMRYITKKGYKKIAYIGKESNLSSFTDREEGFIEGIRTLNINPKNFTVFRLDYYSWAIEIRDVLGKIINEDYDIIYFSQNMLGITGLKILKELNVSIPEEVAVISFDNPDVFEFFNPPITCYEQPLDILAKNALQYLLKMIDGEFVETNQYEKFKGRLIVRESC